MPLFCRENFLFYNFITGKLLFRLCHYQLDLDCMDTYWTEHFHSEPSAGEISTTSNMTEEPHIYE